MIQRRQTCESKQPLRIVDGMNAPSDVVNSGGQKYESVKFAAADQVYKTIDRLGSFSAVDDFRCDAIERDVNGATHRVELRRADRWSQRSISFSD